MGQCFIEKSNKEEEEKDEEVGRRGTGRWERYGSPKASHRGLQLVARVPSLASWQRLVTTLQTAWRISEKLGFHSAASK